MAELLFWPALLAYGHAALAYVGEARRPGLAGRLAIWGVRVGWVAQTALLVAQAARADGFPWSSWAGALNLFSWLVVSAYLIWGSRPRYGLLGLTVMPAVALLLVLAYAGGGIGSEGEHPGVLLAFHVVLMLASFAGFALAAGFSAFYLWHEDRLKRRDVGVLRARVPPLDVLDRVSLRMVAASLATMSAGIAFGVASFVADGGDVDAAMAATVAAWGLYASVLLLRWRRGLHGRHAAILNVLGFSLVVLVLSVTHFAS